MRLDIGKQAAAFGELFAHLRRMNTHLKFLTIFRFITREGGEVQRCKNLQRLRQQKDEICERSNSFAKLSENQDKS